MAMMATVASRARGVAARLPTHHGGDWRALLAQHPGGDPRRGGWPPDRPHATIAPAMAAENVREMAGDDNAPRVSSDCKRIAILVIAATNQPVYVHYINHYWSELIAHTNAHTPHIRVFLLFERDADLRPYKHLRDNIIQDATADLDALCPPQFQMAGVPGILSKTIHALDLLQDDYDVFFRTNLSSVIRLPQFDAHVQRRQQIIYSGPAVWVDGLRDDLLQHGSVGPDRSITSLSDLDQYPGNTFISGFGYFLVRAEVQTLVGNRHRLRWDIVDDVAVGLMLAAHEVLPDFSLTVSADLSIAETVDAIRRSPASHVRLEHLPLEHAQALWTAMASGELWKGSPKREADAARYRIYFPLFDDIEARSNEVRLTDAGLSAHPRVVRVDDPDDADYLIFCQNHLVSHCPFAAQFRPIAQRLRHRSIMLDYDDDPHQICDADDFRWVRYFKRSCVDRETNQVIDYAGLPVLPIAYCVMDEMVEPPPGYSGTRSIAVACLFDDTVIDSPVFSRARGRLLTFAKQFARDHAYPMQIGTVSECGPVGRSALNERYKACLYDSRIVLHANPDWWEGDSRLWEAVASGALVFVDRMRQPIAHPLIDGVHVVFYDLTEDGLRELDERLRYYLDHDAERETIGRQGREFVLAHHRAIHRVNQIVAELDHQATAGARASRRAAAGAFRPGGDAAVPVAADLPDIIVTIAAGYAAVDQYWPFVSTLRRTGARCPVLIGVTDAPGYDAVRDYLRANAVTVLPVSPDVPPHKIASYRFELYRQWLERLPFRYALLLDSRDAYFQRDPFAQIDDFMHDCDLYLMSEFRYLTIGNHPNGMNYAWVRDAFGSAAADAIADRVILNSGAILGRRSAILSLLDAMARVMSAQNYECGDQGALNYLAHTGRLAHCGRIRTARAGLSLVNNCGFSEIDLLQQTRPLTEAERQAIAYIPRDANGRLRLCRDRDGWVLDDDGSVSHVVHQYDRFPEMDAFVAQLAADDVQARARPMWVDPVILKLPSA